MLILGINQGIHDSSVALIRKGEVIFAIEEERLSRFKHDSSFPNLAIDASLRYANVKSSELDAVCVSFDPMAFIKEKFLKYNLVSFPQTLDVLLQEMDIVKSMVGLEEILKEKLDFKQDIFFCPHHEAHMASAYYTSGLNNSALYSIDGMGEIVCSAVGNAEGNLINIYEDKNINFPHSIGLLYAGVTNYLGFKDHSDEGKVMGLAPYGSRKKYREVFDNILQLLKENGQYTLNLDYLRFPFSREEACGPSRRPQDKLEQRHMDIAAGVQRVTEIAMLHTVNHLREISNSPNLCMAGGVALNCVANGKVQRGCDFKKVFVQPGANDAGTAIGAALRYYYLHADNLPKKRPGGTYTGTFYSDKEIETCLKEMGLPYQTHPDIFQKIARELADGRIIGWFNGRMEFGPRALGNRSILTSPFPAEMKDIINDRVKHREDFRPFAPAVLLEDLQLYFEGDQESPYMLMTYKTRKEQVDSIPAVTHVDRMARVQTVTEESNPVLRHLIEAFKSVTGVSVLLNTSFNVMGQPIVETPRQAVECFLGVQMDFLVFNAKFVIDASLVPDEYKKLRT